MQIHGVNLLITHSTSLRRKEPPSNTHVERAAYLSVIEARHLRSYLSYLNDRLPDKTIIHNSIEQSTIHLLIRPAKSKYRAKSTPITCEGDLQQYQG